MERRLLVLLSGIIIIHFASCVSKDTPLILQEVIIGEDVPFYDSVAEPAASLSWSLMVPVDNNKEAHFVRNQIIQILCDSTCSCDSISDAILFYSTRYQQNYRTDNAFINDSEKIIPPKILKLFDDFSEEFVLEPTFNNKGIFSFTLNKNCYSGGAHGTQEEKAYCIDVKLKKSITYTDIFENADTVKLLLINQLLQQFEVKQYEELYDIGFSDFVDFPLTQNISIDEDGITWIYNPYEIAVYSLGIIKITIPYNQLMPFIKNDSAVKRIYK